MLERVSGERANIRLAFGRHRGLAMTLTQKIILVSLLVLGGICLIVGFALMHYIGGFLRTVEEEKAQEEDAARQSDAPQASQSDESTNINA